MRASAMNKDGIALFACLRAQYGLVGSALAQESELPAVNLLTGLDRVWLQAEDGAIYDPLLPQNHVPIPRVVS